MNPEDNLLHQGIGCPIHQVASGPTIPTCQISYSKKATTFGNNKRQPGKNRSKHVLLNQSAKLPFPLKLYKDHSLTVIVHLQEVHQVLQVHLQTDD